MDIIPEIAYTVDIGYSDILDIQSLPLYRTRIYNEITAYIEANIFP